MSKLARPCDRGLSHFGLVVEAWGWMHALTAVPVLVMSVSMSREIVEQIPGSHAASAIIRITVATMLYAVSHLSMAFAGRGLRAGSVRAARVYVVAGVATMLGFVFAVGGFDQPPLGVAAAVLAVIGWPVVIALAIAMRPPSAADVLDHHASLTAESPWRGAGNAMAFAAVVEMLVAAGALYMMPKVRELADGLGVVGAVFAVRAVIQLIAAIAPGPRSIMRYVGVALASTVIATVVEVMQPASELQYVVLQALGVAILGGVWPCVLWRFTRAHAATESMPVAAPDAGRAVIGWVLWFFAAATIGPEILSLFSGGNDNVVIVTVVGSLLQIWAGFELINVTSRALPAVLAYAAARVVLAGLDWRAFFEHASGAGMTELGFPAIATGAQLALPVVTVVLVLAAHRGTDRNPS